MWGERVRGHGNAKASLLHSPGSLPIGPILGEREYRLLKYLIFHFARETKSRNCVGREDPNDEAGTASPAPPKGPKHGAFNPFPFP